MSFSSEVKEELTRKTGAGRHCQIAEIAAMIYLNGDIKMENGGFFLRFHTENQAVSRKCFTLLQKTFNINTEISVGKNPYLKRDSVFIVPVEDSAQAKRVLEASKLIRQKEEGVWELREKPSAVVIQKDCCKRAFIRGAFLTSGSISDPEKFYHFEIVCQNPVKAELIQNVIRSFQIDAKIVARKKAFVVYVKEGAQIVELLGIMGANVALMNLENIRILKEVRNAVNRKVNCEAANIHKTVHAAVKQIEDIRYIEQTVGFQELSEGLEEIASLRLQYPEASLKELGMMLNPQVGKSGVNHRLRKLSTIAQELRASKEEHCYD